MSWLYDTGAAKTCISTTQFQTLFPNGYQDFFHKHKTTSGLQDAGGNSLQLMGIVPMHLTILGKTILHNVWICDKINDAIIGSDLINKFLLQYDTLSHSVHWRNKGHSPILALQQLTTFPALATKIVKTKFHGHIDKFAPQIATIQCKQQKLLQGGPALIKITDDGFCTIAITNCAPYDIKVERGVVVGVVET